jgi:hypothetical protein
MNKDIQFIANQLEVPFANVFGYSGTYTTGHPTGDASNAGWIADKIADAYENNSVPGNPFGSGSPGATTNRRFGN